MRILTVALLLCLPRPMFADQPTPQTQTTQGTTAPLILRDAVARAIQNYPAVQAALANIQVSAAGVDLARTSYFPRADLLWQMNRATRNSVTGLVLPQPVVAGISGGIGVDRNE